MVRHQAKILTMIGLQLFHCSKHEELAPWIWIWNLENCKAVVREDNLNTI
jgi:hypothetical protein